MDTEFIPAVCPNCGGKLQVEPNADTLTCQFCGTEHIIRRNVTGAVILEAYARCPFCKRNDRSEKVSAILINQTAQSESVTTQKQVFTDSKGQIHTETVNVPVKTVQTSNLAQYLIPPPPPTPPPPPAQSKGGATGNILIYAFIMMVIGFFGFAINSGNSNSISWGGSWVCGVLPMFVALYLFSRWFFSRKEVQEKAIQQQVSLNNAQQQWERSRNNAQQQWQQIVQGFFCKIKIKIKIKCIL